MPFIVGVGRSGTTLLRLMLDAHHELAIPPETHFIGALLRGDRYRLVGAEEFYRLIVENIRWGDFKLDRQEFQKRIESLRPFTLGEGLRCFYRMYADRFGKGRYGDKTPMHGVHLSTLKSILGEAYFIHLIRDGRDVALSQIKNFPHWKTETDIRGPARLWAATILETRRQAAGCADYLEIRYEDLVLKTEATLQTICQALRLRYDPAMERYYLGAESRLAEFDDLYSSGGELLETKAQRLSQHRHALEPPNRLCLGRWRQEMSLSDRNAFESVAGDLLQSCGYEV